MLPSVYRYFAVALPFFTWSLSTSSSDDYFFKLKTAVSDNDVKTVRELLRQKPNLDWLTEDRGWEIARIAAENGNLPMIEFIARHKLSVLKEKNVENGTIGHIAAKHGHPEITEYFLKKTKGSYGSSLWSERRSLFDLVAEKGYLNCISGCVDRYFDDLKRIAEIATQNGHLDVACSAGLEQHIAYCKDFGDIIKTAIKKSSRRDPKTLELFGKLADKWTREDYCPDILKLALSMNDTKLIQYLAEEKCTYFLKCVRDSFDSCKLMKIAIKRNLVNRNFLDCLKRKKVSVQEYIGKSKLTICHHAAKYHRLDVVRLLVQRNASVLERSDAYGDTAVNWAAKKGYADIVRYAVRQNPLTRVQKAWYLTSGGDIDHHHVDLRLYFSTAFRLAVAENLMDMDTLKYAVEKKGTDLITGADPYDNGTAAHFAAANANIKILQYLVTRNPSVLSMLDSQGETALHILARKSKFSEKWLKFFVDMGAPLAVKSRKKETVGHILAKNGHTAFVKYLAEKDPSVLTIRDGSGDTILHILARRRKMNIQDFGFFVDKASALKGKASIGVEVAETAASGGHSNILKFIVDKKPSLLADNPSVLFKLPDATQVLDMLQYLETACEAKIRNWDRRTFGDKVLTEALEYDDPDILRFMKYDVNMVNDEGEPLILTAVRRDRSNVFYYLASDKRTNLTALDGRGNNILFIAAMHRDLKKMQYILDTLEAPIDIEWRNEDGNSLLHVAVHEALSQADEAQNGPVDESPEEGIGLIKYLVEEKHARTDTTGHENMTALACATRRGNYLISNYLLDHGARPKVRNANEPNFWKVMHFPTPESASVGTSRRKSYYGW